MCRRVDRIAPPLKQTESVLSVAVAWVAAVIPPRGHRNRAVKIVFVVFVRAAVCGRVGVVVGGGFSCDGSGSDAVRTVAQPEFLHRLGSVTRCSALTKRVPA